MRQLPASLRQCFIACLLAISLLAVSAAAFAPAHLHGSLKSDACAVCKASETPILKTMTAVDVWPPCSITEYLEDIYDGIPLEGRAGSSHSRAPPSLYHLSASAEREERWELNLFVYSY